jgi:hypothetical protein
MHVVHWQGKKEGWSKCQSYDEALDFVCALMRGEVEFAEILDEKAFQAFLDTGE